VMLRKLATHASGGTSSFPAKKPFRKPCLSEGISSLLEATNLLAGETTRNASKIGTFCWAKGSHEGFVDG